ncbi:GntR family transcriptional regulator [Peptoniphilus catoniae]|uniref:GntR family transcriptional regulator n=1 Tax=Peptoniphilus catoniae TaxID=1660341 RepID=UPI0010FEFF16|nr:GntR family transcriptional regulator [Peptoniphilus catoniae]
MMFANKESLSSFVYKELKNKILNNELLPGDKLVEMEIARELGVSRTPVREALFKLEKDDLAQSFPRKSFIVSKLSLADAKDLYVVRSALEPIAVREIAREGITERTKILKEIINDMKIAYEKKDLKESKELSIKWGKAIMNLTKNQILKNTLIEINDRLYRFANFIFREEENIRRVYSTIVKIYDAIENKEIEKSYKISYEYVSSIYPMIESQNDYRSFKYE